MAIVCTLFIKSMDGNVAKYYCRNIYLPIYLAIKIWLDVARNAHGKYIRFLIAITRVWYRDKRTATLYTRTGNPYRLYAVKILFEISFFTDVRIFKVYGIERDTKIRLSKKNEKMSMK